MNVNHIIPGRKHETHGHTGTTQQQQQNTRYRCAVVGETSGAHAPHAHTLTSHLRDWPLAWLLLLRHHEESRDRGRAQQKTGQIVAAAGNARPTVHSHAESRAKCTRVSAVNNNNNSWDAVSVSAYVLGELVRCRPKVVLTGMSIVSPHWRRSYLAVSSLSWTGNIQHHLNAVIPNR